ncbi:MAG: NapC/NirT family cytochrome c [Bryobacteraceae bacterium]|jgi:nitrate/TMAO reductase-like tetraheme cytochrome c subunit
MPTSKPPITRLYEWLSPIVFLSSNPISLTGVVVVTTATVLWVFLLPTLFGHGTNNPYLGIPIFLLLPGLFIIGLILIPIGIVLRRRSRQRHGLPVTSIPQLRLDSPELRRLIGFVAVASFVNVVIASQWGYSTINYMDSAQFCGLTCHKVMQPEYTAYVNSPHADVACAECHIGPGASWFVRSKLSGVRQVFAVAFNTYSRPIPSPVENLRPARETCEECHWPARFSGDVFTVLTSYGSDQDNQATSTVLLMKVGGRTWRGSEGIHGAHLAANSQMVYTATDRQRQVIPKVIYTAPDGKVTVYNSASAKATAADHGETRTMDCVDCHNRPTHAFQLPERAVDVAMGQGQISPKLPFIKREAVAALRRNYPDRDTAPREIAASLDKFYRTNYASESASNATEIKNAISAVQAIYLRNIFPDMKITWGTYPNNLGHMDFPGCFRCHDGDHQSADGRTIPNDCATCHDLLAVDEKNPKVLSGLGYNAGVAPGGLQ